MFTLEPVNLIIIGKILGIVQTFSNTSWDLMQGYLRALMCRTT